MSKKIRTIFAVKSRHNHRGMNIIRLHTPFVASEEKDLLSIMNFVKTSYKLWARFGRARGKMVISPL